MSDTTAPAAGRSRTRPSTVGVVSAAVMLASLTACGDDVSSGDSTSKNESQRNDCVDSSNIVLLADPLDDWGDNVMLGCVTPDTYIAILRATPRPAGETGG